MSDNKKDESIFDWHERNMPGTKLMRLRSDALVQMAEQARKEDWTAAQVHEALQAADFYTCDATDKPAA